MKKERLEHIMAAMMAMTVVVVYPQCRRTALRKMRRGPGVFQQSDCKPLTAKVIDANPYMGKGDSNIHHDCYNTDSTDEILPLAVYPEINVSLI